jgi:RNA polymerase sigma-70 factor (ECF subfamily)
MPSWIREEFPTTGEMRVRLSAMNDVELAASRDRAAFLELYDRYVARIERYVAARTSSTEVEDLVSVTFERALTRRASFKPGKGTYAGWLFAIARNTVADSYRARNRATKRMVAPSEEDLAPDPEQAVLVREDRARVRAALEDLTEDQRDALALRFAAELPFSEIGRALGKSEPAAKMLVQRGLKSMRRLLEERNDDQ